MNLSAGMTSTQYFEMCEMLGEAIVEENIPIEFEDLPLIIQVAFGVYNQLQDNWDYIAGNYLGKIKYNITETFELLGIEKSDYREVFTFINLIDRARSEIIASNKQEAPTT